MLTLTQFKTKERERQAALAKARLLHIACDDCGAQLVDSRPDTTLPTAPPQIYVHCSACKWTGQAPASARQEVPAVNPRGWG